MHLFFAYRVPLLLLLLHLFPCYPNPGRSLVTLVVLTYVFVSLSPPSTSATYPPSSFIQLQYGHILIKELTLHLIRVLHTSTCYLSYSSHAQNPMFKRSPSRCFSSPFVAGPTG
ncbi:hypothetical protein DFP72DRAFT_576367 [Ephemerocybe angulata]|uniref:Secreted protein n=1 Tax=Ephemerocybe angulata TaxID=980116 RepID=A0A8H6LY69_9AGAR|nr:hypothetical protein DFP72DRAFT_576367 [Tulosesus angulatus]